MNFIRITVDTILIINLLILPGSIFLSTISRWAFPRGRVLQKRLNFLVFSILFSLMITVTFDRPPVKDFIFKNIISSELLKSQTSDKFKQFFSSKKILEETLSNLDSKQESNMYERRESMYRLVASSFLLMIYTFILSSILTIIIVSTNFLIHRSGFTIVLNGLYYTTPILLKPIYMITMKLVTLFKLQINWHPTIKKAYDKFVIALVAVLIAVFLLGTPLYILLTLILVILIALYESFFFILYKISNLLRHPLHETFYSFSARYFLPIIEIRTSDKSLYKGKLVSYEPKNENEIYSISLTNVIQYKPNKETETFERGKRSAYEFETSNSILTILESEIRDFNLWYLDYESESWKFNIQEESDIQNQLWYLNLLITNNKLGFKTSCLNIACIDKYSYKLLKEITEIIIHEYSSFIYKSKKKQILSQILKKIDSLWDTQKNDVNINQKDKKLLFKEKQELLTKINNILVPIKPK